MATLVIIPTPILLLLLCLSSLVLAEEYNQRENRLLYQPETRFQCESEGFYPDPLDCTIFYKCIDWHIGLENSLQPQFTLFKYQCKIGTIYDAQINSCIPSNESMLKKCLKQNYKPYSIDILRANSVQITNNNKNNQDYGVIQSQGHNPPQVQPLYGQTNQGSQLEPIGEIDNGITEKMPPRIIRSPPCSTEGFFPIENDCSHFYRCVGNESGFSKYEFSCAGGTIWDPKTNACNHIWAVERDDCKKINLNEDTDAINYINENDHSSYPGQSSHIPSSSEEPMVEYNSNIAYQPSNPDNSYQPLNPSNNYQPSLPSKDPNQGNIDYGYNPMVSSNNENSSANNNNHNLLCPSEGFHPVENNCKKFIRCVYNGLGGFIHYEFDCADGTIWDNDSVTCNYPHAVQDPKCKVNLTNDNSPLIQGSSYNSNQQTSSPSPNQNTSPTPTSQSSSLHSQTIQSNNQQTSSFNLQSSSINQQTSSISSQTSSSFSQQTSSINGQQTSLNSNQVTRPSSNYNGGSFASNQQTTSNQQNFTSGTSQQNSSFNQQSTTSTSNQQVISNQQNLINNGNQQTTNNQLNTQTTSNNEITSNNQLTNSESNSQDNSSLINNFGNSSNNMITENKCVAEGFFPSPTNCNKFYRCVKNEGSSFTKYDFNCGPGTVWDSDNNVCNYPWAVQNEKCRSNGNQNIIPAPEISNTTNHDNFTSVTSSTSTYPFTDSSPWSSSLITSVESSSTPVFPSSGSESFSTPSIINTTQSSPIPSYPSTIPSNENLSTPAPNLENSTSNLNENTMVSNPIDFNISSTQEPTNEINSIGSQYPSTTSIPDNIDLNNVTSSPSNGISTDMSTINNNITCGNDTKPPSKIICTKAGFYPHPYDCKKFYRCVDWDGDKNQRFSIYHFNCPDGTIFDPSLNTCNHADSVYPPRDCNNNTQLMTEMPTSITNTTDGTTSMSNPSINSTVPPDSSNLPTNSTDFTGNTTPFGENPITVTNEGTTNLSTDLSTESTTINEFHANNTLTTPNSSMGIISTTNEETTPMTTSTFNSIITSSESPTDYYTSSSNLTSISVTTSKPDETVNSVTTQNPITEAITTPNTFSEMCPELGPNQFALICPTGFRRHPKYCNLFYQCTVSPSNEIKVLTLSCTNGTIYDDKKIQCLPPGEAKKCDGSMMDLRNLRKITDNSVAPIQVKSDKSICPNEGFFPFKDDCRLFYKCKNDEEGRLNGFVYQCPEGFGYWTISKRCEKIEKVPCEAGLLSKPVAKLTLAPVETKNIGHK